jgi:parallel beta-helix repeat protein
MQPLNAGEFAGRQTSNMTTNPISSIRPLRIVALCLLATVLGLLQASPAATLNVPQAYRTIQAAIEAASFGDTVLVSAGSYQERLRLKPGITVRSVGNDAKGELGLKRAERTIIDGGGERGQGPGVQMAEKATFDGFTVTQVGRYDDAKWKKHHATRGEEQSHERIGQAGDTGIAATGVSCTIRHNIVHHNGDTGIGITGADDQSCSPWVIENICYRNMGGGIGSMKGSTATIQANVCFENFYAGIGQSGASPLVVSNLCYGNVRAGIGISEGSTPIVRGNKCYANRRAGIGIRTGEETRPAVEGNDCYENGMAGIGIRDEAAPFVRGNRCFKNKLAGIGVRGGARPLLIGNECYENELAGIGHESGVVSTVMANYCHHNKAAGIGFEAGKTGDATVVNNRVIDNAMVAVGIQNGWTVRLSGNELSRKEGVPPIVMVFQGAQATLTDNVIRGSGVAGIRVAGKVRADHNRFEGADSHEGGPPNLAIWALAGSRVEMTGNDIRGWRHALQATGADVLVAGNTVAGFQGAAFVVQKPSSPAHVYDNTAIGGRPEDRVLSLDGLRGIVRGNRMR